MTIYSRILVAVDGSEPSERGLHEALALAADQKARLVAVNVIDDFPLVVEISTAIYLEESRQLMRKQAHGLMHGVRRRAAALGLEVDAVVIETHGRRVADLVIETAAEKGCNLIVMGTHGRRGLSRLTLGSDAELVLRGARVPVLLVRAADASH